MKKTHLISLIAVGAAVAIGAMLLRGGDVAGNDSAAGADGGAIVTVALPVSLSENAQIGQRAYEAKCAACHGINAVGQQGMAPPLVHKIYEPSHHGDMAFQRAVQFGVKAHHWRFGDMAPVAGLTPADVKMITQYVRELQRENGIF